jgi:hypothetical protein
VADAPATCAEVSRGFDEDPAGTASRQRAWLLIEQPGAWGPDALLESKLDAAVAQEIDRRRREAKVRVLLIRRGPGADDSGERRWVFVRSTPSDSVLGGGFFGDDDELVELDLGGMARGEVGLPTGMQGPLFAVCTHGRHDRCCADFGRPVVRALRTAGVDVWECSHIGGDRFAANLVAFPHGLYYARVTPATAVPLIQAYIGGRIVPDGFRGRASLPPPAQWAEIDLRRSLDLWDVDAVTYLGSRKDGAEVSVIFAIPDGSEHEVCVRVGQDDEPRLLSCRGNEGPVRSITPVSIRPVR